MNAKYHNIVYRYIYYSKTLAVHIMADRFVLVYYYKDTLYLGGAMTMASQLAKAMVEILINLPTL